MKLAGTVKTIFPDVIAFFKGGIDIRKSESKPTIIPNAPATTEAARPVQ